MCRGLALVLTLWLFTGVTLPVCYAHERNGVEPGSGEGRISGNATPGMKLELSGQTDSDSTSKAIPDSISKPAVTVTAILNREALETLPSFTLRLRSVPSDDEMDALYLLALEHRTVNALVSRDGEMVQETLVVEWDFDGIDQTMAGSYAAVGTILLPEGYIFGADVLREIRIPVQVKALPPAILTAVETWYPYSDAAVLLQGSSLDKLESYLVGFCLECWDDSGTGYMAPVIWDLSGVDPDTVGLYQAVGRLSVPENTLFSEEMVLPEITVPVSVQAKGRPDINCFFFGQGAMIFPWVSPLGDLKKLVCGSRKTTENGGKWRTATPKRRCWDSSQNDLA